MNFINEYVPQEDIDRFNLDALWNRFNPDSDPLPIDTFKHYWTIDKKEDCWFMHLTLVKEEEESDTFPIYTNEYVFMLHYKNIDIEVHLKKIREESSVHYSESPFHIVWELESLSPSTINDIKSEEIEEVLKEALNTYGDNGIKWQVENTIVHCKF